MGFEKGKPKTGGRSAGTPNELTKSVKETVLNAFNEMQGQPKVNLIEWGKENPALFYQIAAKLIPTEITGTIKTVIKCVVRDG